MATIAASPVSSRSDKVMRVSSGRSTDILPGRGTRCYLCRVGRVRRGPPLAWFGGTRVTRPTIRESAVYAILAALVLAADPAAAELPPIIRSAASGPWSAAVTWDGGKVPATGDRVLIRGGHRVVYDVQSE